MSKGWRERKRQNKAVDVTQKQLTIVQESILALRAVLETATKDPAQLLCVANRLDALLRRQDRLQRVIERVQTRASHHQTAESLATANAELEAKLARRGLLTFKKDGLAMR
jgi:hypothetical protein